MALFFALMRNPLRPEFAVASMVLKVFQPDVVIDWAALHALGATVTWREVAAPFTAVEVKKAITGLLLVGSMVTSILDPPFVPTACWLSAPKVRLEEQDEAPLLHVFTRSIVFQAVHSPAVDIAVQLK